MAERRMPSVDEFPANNGKEEIKKVDPIEPMKMKGAVKTRHSVAKSVGVDGSGVGNYILYDILFPALRDLVLDIGHGALDAAMGNERGYRSHSGYGQRNSYVSYNRMYDERDRRRRDRDEERYESRRHNRNLDDIIFDYREDAEDALDRMVDYLERYDDVPVSFLYDICGMTVPGDFTKDDWGWRSLADARVRKVRNGYILDLPRIRPI